MEKTESQGRRRTQKAKGETSQEKGNQVRIHNVDLVIILWHKIIV